MKKTKFFNFAVIGLLAMQISLVSCNKPKEREETVDSSIAPYLVAIADLRDISTETSKAYFYKDQPNSEVSASEKTAVQIKTNASVNKVFSLIKKDENKKALDAQLATGAIAFSILTDLEIVDKDKPAEKIDKLIIYKVLPKAKIAESNEVKSILDIRKMKKESLESRNLSASHIDISETKSELGYVEIASLKIVKSGVLENKLTKYYNEKTSILTVVDRPLDVSTHLVLEPQKTAEEEKKLNMK